MLQGEGKMRVCNSLVKEILPEDIYGEINKNFTGNPFFYAVLEDAIVLGIYQNGQLLAGIAKDGTCSIKTLMAEEILEIRVFDKEKEWKALKMGDTFSIRLKKDVQEEQEPGFVEETQKMWGAVKVSVQIPGWCLLESGRGSRILVPLEGEVGQEKAVIVRKYYETPDQDRELFRFTDERLCDITEWQKQEEVIRSKEENHED